MVYYFKKRKEKDQSFQDCGLQNGETQKKLKCQMIEILFTKSIVRRHLFKYVDCSLIYANNLGKKEVDANPKRFSLKDLECEVMVSLQSSVSVKWGVFAKRGSLTGKYQWTTSHSKSRAKDDTTWQCIQHQVSAIIHLSDESHQH